MIVDASALVAIAFSEPDARIFAEALSHAPGSRISSVNWLEVVVRLDREGDPVAIARFEELERLPGLWVVAATASHAKIARDAYRRFGKGSGHKAQLNLGDCFAYALAHEERDVLLFKGRDFVHTDIEPALKA